MLGKVLFVKIQPNKGKFKISDYLEPLKFTHLLNPLIMNNLHFSVLGSRFSVLGSRFSVLGSRFSVLVALIFLLALNPANAQNDNCGTPDLPWPQYQELLDDRGPGPYVSGTQNYDLPIWFNLVSPETPGLGWLSLFDPLAMVASLNSYFAGSGTGIQFHLCGVSYLYSDALVNLDLTTEQGDLRMLAQSNNPNYNNVINVNLVNWLTIGQDIPAGFAGMPSLTGVGAIYLRSPENYVLPHEMGHYLTRIIHGRSVFPPPSGISILTG